jgi:hypothetical protein
MLSAGVTLIQAGTATSAGQQWPGGRGQFVVVATTFDNEKVTLEFLGPDGSTWLPVIDSAGNEVELSQNGSALFELPPCTIRAAVSTGGGSPAGIYAAASRIPY